MNVSQVEFQNMKEVIVKDMISRLMEERGLSMQDAFDKVYNSRLFEKLSDPKTGLYFQSSGYVYSYLLDELSLDVGCGFTVTCCWLNRNVLINTHVDLYKYRFIL